MLYSQPLATRFGTDLKNYLASPAWASLDIAVAWIRASGLRHIAVSLADFLKAGKKLRVIVGIDLDNTTKEGLQGLIDLATHGNVQAFVHHNEGGGVFHPKLYLLTSKTQARLIVASNNLTQAGLFQNTEVGLAVDLPIADPLIKSAQDALEAWCDVTSGLARKLDSAFLAELIANGYVRDEASVRAEASARRAKAKTATSKKLFGSAPVSVPPAPTGGGPAGKSKAPVAKGAASSAAAALPTAPTGGSGSVLLMRLRKASVTGRPTQTQLPKAVVAQPFFSGIHQVVSSHNGEKHPISEAVANGIVNTLKLEIPEMRKFADPVVRFERTASSVIYEVYDASTAKGKTIMNGLNLGLSTTPPSTFMTLPTKPTSATWWRFI